MSTSAAFGAVGELAASRHGVISSTQAAALGVNARSLLRFSQRGLLHPAGAGVYVVAGSPPTWHQRTLVAVLSAGSGAVARLDLAVPRVRLGIEAHSREFHIGLAREAADERRDNRLARLGWEVLYVGFDDVRRPSAVAVLIADVVARRAGDLRPAA